LNCAARIATNVSHALRVLAAGMTVAGAHSDPVGIERKQGPHTVRHPLALAIAECVTFPEALAVAFAADPRDLDACVADAVAGSIVHKGPRPADAAALWAAVGSSPDLPAYLALFRTEPRAVSLRALNECGGEGMESAYAERAFDDLAQQAALVAHGKKWLPEPMRGGAA
jgi:hypothetical protein